MNTLDQRTELRIAMFERFDIEMTLEQAQGASHPGRCDDDVEALARDPKIAAQLDALNAETVRAELAEYGAWDAAELADDEACRLRITWLAAASISDDEFTARPVKA